MDFSLILVLATLLSGLIWGAHAILRRMRYSGADLPAAYREPVLVEYARSFFPILLIVLIIRSFIFEPFRIPSSSMMPTLLVGDFIFVNKYTYGLRLPVTNTLILEVGSPDRGDVAVFRLPSDPNTNYIKRLIGLPGDTIRYADKRLYVNGDPVPLEILGRGDGLGQPGAMRAMERLGSAPHEILIVPGARSAEGTFVVPDGHYFFMGDNRDNSRDSRYDGVGFVSEDLMVGRAERIWMNWEFPGGPRWSRIGMRID